MEEKRSEARKLIVLIPTRDRPGYLGLTLRSVVEQAKRFGHENVEVVVSDQSYPANAARNRKKITRLANTYGTPIHYYNYNERPEFLKELLQNASENERNAYEQLTPNDGHYGAQRNFLALMAVRHGGQNALYLHLDDDTPIAAANERGKIKKLEEDAFKRVFKEVDTIPKGTRTPGIWFNRTGLVDSANSMTRFNQSLREGLMSPKTSKGVISPGRLLFPEYMQVPYFPKGVNSDLDHNECIRLRYVNTPGAPLLLHIGMKGPRPSQEGIRFRYLPEQIVDAWKSLVKKSMHGSTASK
ncbi:hypothetical protein AUJ65_05530 [Candidatus Micrarchaeota archaeon CG1_02_51_15]|nr:MAG: hypothetical protein AUJ65_05530 [Candidatus Micrarchaeota archaeon CG1_02_51_15]